MRVPLTRHLLAGLPALAFVLSPSLCLAQDAPGAAPGRHAASVEVYPLQQSWFNVNDWRVSDEHVSETVSTGLWMGLAYDFCPIPCLCVGAGADVERPSGELKYGLRYHDLNLLHLTGRLKGVLPLGDGAVDLWLLTKAGLSFGWTDIVYEHRYRGYAVFASAGATAWVWPSLGILAGGGIGLDGLDLVSQDDPSHISGQDHVGAIHFFILDLGISYRF